MCGRWREGLPAMGGFEMIAREHSELNAQTPDAVKLSRRRSLACLRSLCSVLPTALPAWGLTIGTASVRY